VDVLVTGASGFIGANLVRTLLAEGTRVRALVRRTSSLQALTGCSVDVVPGDILDPDSLTPAVAGCRVVFHVAADYRLWAPDPAVLYRNNVDGTRNVLEACVRAGVQRVVYTSSVGTLGIPADGRPGTETTPVSLGDMIGPYKRSKFEAEEVVSALVGERGLPAVIVNPSTPIGAGDVKPTPTGRIIVEAARGRMPGYVDTGLNVVHVDDVALGHLLAAQHGEVGRRYILGGENMTLAEILTEVARVSGQRPPSLKIPYGVALPIAAGAEALARLTGREPFATVDGVRMSRKKMFFSADRAIRELGYAPRPARQAIADAVAWFKANGYLE
jgi:dihydroflavonol-4-reductase